LAGSTLLNTCSLDIGRARGILVTGYCTVLYCTVLYCTVLYCNVQWTPSTVHNVRVVLNARYWEQLGHWTLDRRPRLRTLDEGHRTGHLTTNVHFKTLWQWTTDNGHLTPDIRFRTLDYGHWTSDSGHRTQDIGLRTSDSGH
jgi:hypothetical protein